jgi:hypothetical protein
MCRLCQKGWRAEGIKGLRPADEAPKLVVLVKADSVVVIAVNDQCEDRRITARRPRDRIRSAPRRGAALENGDRRARRAIRPAGNSGPRAKRVVCSADNSIKGRLVAAQG